MIAFMSSSGCSLPDKIAGKVKKMLRKCQKKELILSGQSEVLK